MPLTKYNSKIFQPWCEVKDYSILKLQPGENITLETDYPKEMIFICKGICEICSGLENLVLRKGDSYKVNSENLDIKNADKTLVEMSVILRLSGRWTDKTGGNGVFELDKSDNPRNIGDSVKYFRNTDFDNHFHDCDEYWFILEGKGVAVTEGNMFDVEAGDCVLTRKGQHHDFPVVLEKILGVYFETGLSGKMRTGHLWDHTHEK